MKPLRDYFGGNNMTFAIRVVGEQRPRGLVRCSMSGQYLRAFAVHKHDGRAPIPTTPHVEKAAIFPTPADAIKFYRTRSHVVPTRPDGEPNRPLTALTVEVVPL